MGLPLRDARVDTSAIVHNLQLLRNAAGTELLADVSADAYGHGALPVARAVQDAGVRSFVVATVAQGIALRRGRIDTEILAWLHPAAESFQAAAEHGITVVVSSPEQLTAASTAGVSSVHLAAAVGGHAVGCAEEHWSGLIDTAVRFRNEGLTVTGIMGIPPQRTPASRADQGLLRADQLEFRRRVAAARHAGLDPELNHLAGSAATMAGVLDPADVDPHSAARVGRALYGLSPFIGETAAELGLIGAMTITARVIGTKTVDAGEGISYGYTYRTSTRSNLALVAIGYAHGIDRYASNTATARLNGNDYPIAGRVAMDVFVLDLGADTADVGDDVVLFGAGANPSAERWAEAIGTTAQRVVSGITPRVPRVYSPAIPEPEPAKQEPGNATAPGVATIDLDAYRRNVARLRSVVAPAELMVMIKGNAYGHGLLPIARTAIGEGITRIGVLEIATGLRLRRAGIGREVSLFAWLLAPGDDYRAAIDSGIELGISDVAQLRAIAASGAHDSAKLHLKIDTGLHRNGVTEEDWPELVREAVALEAAGKAQTVRSVDAHRRSIRRRGHGSAATIPAGRPHGGATGRSLPAEAPGRQRRRLRQSRLPLRPGADGRVHLRHLTGRRCHTGRARSGPGDDPQRPGGVPGARPRGIPSGLRTGCPRRRSRRRAGHDRRHPVSGGCCRAEPHGDRRQRPAGGRCSPRGQCGGLRQG